MGQWFPKGVKGVQYLRSIFPISKIFEKSWISQNVPKSRLNPPSQGVSLSHNVLLLIGKIDIVLTYYVTRHLLVVLWVGLRTLFWIKPFMWNTLRAASSKSLSSVPISALHQLPQTSNIKSVKACLTDNKNHAISNPQMHNLCKSTKLKSKISTTHTQKKTRNIILRTTAYVLEKYKNNPRV